MSIKEISRETFFTSLKVQMNKLLEKYAIGANLHKGQFYVSEILNLTFQNLYKRRTILLTKRQIQS